MNKKFLKIICAIIFILACFFVHSSALAYDGDGYYVDIPSSYTQEGNNSWQNKSSGVRLIITQTTYPTGVLSDEELLKQASEQSINVLKSSGSAFNMVKSEVIKVNNFNCMNIAYNYSGVNMEQYGILSNGKFYVFTFSSISNGELPSSEMMQIVESFKVTGVNQEQKSSTTNELKNKNINSNSSKNTIENTTKANNIVNNATNDSNNNKSSKNNTSENNTSKYTEKDNKSSKKNKSSKSDDDDDDDETEINWVIVIAIASAIVIGIIITVIIIKVVASKNKKD